LEDKPWNQKPKQNWLGKKPYLTSKCENTTPKKEQW
jgi:hypothetical protein